MAEVKVITFMAFRCPHCAAIVQPHDQMFRDGIKQVTSHECPDGHIETMFQDALAVVRCSLILSTHHERIMALRNAASGTYT